MSSQTCYWPGGSAAGSNVVPAESNDSSGNAACCFTGHYLFSNGLCLDINEMTFYRGGCTDKTWASPACPRYCLSVSAQQCGIWACNNDNQFACNPSDCGTSTSMFTVNGGSIKQNAALNSAISTITSSTTSATSSTSTSASSTASSSATQASGTGLAITSPTGTACPSHIGAYAGLGVGLGIPLIISLVALIFVVLRLRNHKKAMGVNSSAGYANNGHQPPAQYISQPTNYPSNNGYPQHTMYNQQDKPKVELSSTSRYPTAELGS